jgi:hypothetical protein
MSLNAAERETLITLNDEDETAEVWTAPSGALTVSEERALALAERHIRDGVAKVEVAFRHIRDQRLYRATHKSFDAYCRDVWSVTRRAVDRKIAFALEVEEAETHGSQPPANERQSRAKTTKAKTPETPAKINERPVVAEVLEAEVLEAEIEDGEWAPIVAASSPEQTPGDSAVDPVRHIERAIADVAAMSDQGLMTELVLVPIEAALERLRAEVSVVRQIDCLPDEEFERLHVAGACAQAWGVEA